MIGVLPPQGQEAVKSALNLVNTYGSALGITAYWGSTQERPNSALINAARAHGEMHRLLKIVVAIVDPENPRRG